MIGGKVLGTIARLAAGRRKQVAPGAVLPVERYVGGKNSIYRRKKTERTSSDSKAAAQGTENGEGYAQSKNEDAPRRNAKVSDEREKNIFALSTFSSKR